MMKQATATLTCCIALLTAAGFAGKYGRMCELSSHFRVQYAVLLLVFVVVLAMHRSWKWTALGAAGFAANLILILPYSGIGTKPQTAPDLRLASCNVKFSNTQYARFLEFVEDVHPDVLFIQEANRPWLQELEGLQRDYPYHRYEPNRNGFGIAVYSRLPFRKAEVHNIEVPYILVRVRVKDRPVWLLNTHLYTPTNSWHFANRNQEIHSLATVINALRGPAIVAGDFNMTEWSPYYSWFVSNVGLIDVRKGRGVFSTYPAGNPFFRIPIDLCFVNRDIQVANVTTGPNTGSDHLPLIVDLSLRTGMQ